MICLVLGAAPIGCMSPWCLRANGVEVVLHACDSGILYDKLRRFGEAVDDFTAVLKLSTDPKQRANAYLNRGSAFDQLGHFERAMMDYTHGTMAEGPVATTVAAEAHGPACAAGGQGAHFAPLAAGLRMQ